MANKPTSILGFATKAEIQAIVLASEKRIAALISQAIPPSGLRWATNKDVEKTERLIRMTQAELAAGLAQLTAQIGKVAAEQAARFDALSATIAQLQAVIAAGGDVTPEVTDALTNVQTALQALDDTIPDAPQAKKP